MFDIKKVVIIACFALTTSGCDYFGTKPKEVVTPDDATIEKRAAKPAVAAKDWAAIRAIEAKTGGRIGAALIDSTGKISYAWRGDERFAMCSTFKLPLVATVLARVDREDITLDDKITIKKSDMLNNSPIVAAALKSAGGIEAEMTIAQLAAGTIQTSDNASANLLLIPVGGPAGMTAQLRAWGDTVTRVDRNEPSMNENVPGDPRDTTSPVAMTNLMRTMMEGKVLTPDLRTQLIRWTVGTTTGANRIKAGLPGDTLLGHKTGTCGTAWNDIGFFRRKDGMGFGANAYYLSVYIDRPTAPEAEVEAAIAQIAKLAFAQAEAADMQAVAKRLK